MPARFMNSITIQPARRLRGALRVPGDKSISHRLALLASIADGESWISNFSSSADCGSTLDCLRSLGVRVTVLEAYRVRIEGRGLRGLERPAEVLNAGNSGSTLRMLAGLLAGHPFHSTMTGDESLRKRPMGRIIVPLSEMGARIEAAEEQKPPLHIFGASLHGIRYTLPIPSAQVKTAILLAGVLAEGKTEVIEPLPTRNHTEIALSRFGAKMKTDGPSIQITGGRRLRAGTFSVPGDCSSAAFWIAAGLMVPDSEIRLVEVGLNPTRLRFLEVILSMGGELRFPNPRERDGEPVGDIVARASRLSGGHIDPSDVPALMDEIPILAVLGAQSVNGLVVRGARELRVKESDRIAAVVRNLRAMGAEVEEFEDGFAVKGNQVLKGASIDSFGDHRIAMAFSIAALCADSPSTIHDADCVKISFPEFFDILGTLSQ